MKKLMVAIMALALMAFTGSAFADEPGTSGDYAAQMSAAGSSESTMFPSGDVVETGAVPEWRDSVNSDGVIPPISSQFNPSQSGTRYEDLGGGGE